MTIILLVTIAILAVVILLQWRKHRIFRTGAILVTNSMQAEVEKYSDLYDQVRRNYDALDEGNQEIVDNYENDLLDMKTRMEASYNAAAYDRQMREEVEKKLEQANLIIEKHSDKCDILVEDIADMLIAEAIPREE
jgi:hypothetical protein